jgi:DNA-binding helix-turn-helix protein
MSEKLTTSDRLKQIMNERNLKQVDILSRCEPYCIKYNVKLNKNDLSQYISGKVVPGQDKLTILSMALNVNEVWLMGYNVPSEQDALCKMEKNISDDANFNLEIQNHYGKVVLAAVIKFRLLDETDQIRILERMEMLLEDEKYKE